MAIRKKEYLWEKNYPENIKWDNPIILQPLHMILDESAKKYGDCVCVDYYGKIYSYNDILKLSDKFAKGLQDNGVKKGDKVGLLMPNCPLFIIAYYGILKAGGIVVNYNPLYTVNELVHQVQDSKTKIMVTLNLGLVFDKTASLLQSTMLEKVIVGDFKKQLPLLKGVMFGLFKKKSVASVSYGEANICADSFYENDGNFKHVEINPKEDVAVLQYTGGTTGSPKGAMLTHANLYGNTIQTGAWFEGLKEGEEVMFGVLPFFHVFAMTVVMNLSILKACKIVIHSRLEIGNLLKDIPKKKITLMPGVPTLFTALNNHEKTPSYNLSSLKFCISGGAPLPLEVKERFEEISGCKLIEGYGLTESSPVAVANPLFGENKKGAIGIPLPNTVVEIMDIEGERKPMPIGEIGEICIKGPQVMKGYLGNEAETKATIRSGWLHTGDMGYMDKDGYIYIVDRLKEMIITSGFNVYPREIEEELYKHPCIEEASVLGVSDDEKGQLVKAYIKLKQEEVVTEAQIKEFLKGKLAKYKQPAYIEFVDEMPKSLIGKILKRELAKKDKVGES
ncbi:MAG: long-chain fatty acid--CoA ligase [Rickettsiales bacterium]|nr:long-chain fatty acid--CoA ligase [Pseudomonadota bacterium]MDA0966214.1 long-chain fatty acid--CoA ligase [Pseudomonadota bacterium]MDG4543121.1 long-chain fatty acid--CoA ligase [Rickettsiales bacterium]MDG4545319.1 long-chain fatty acid--CoA ligase [Rickettsiales bacterium]MDG4547768.1 long-chain fatty acid--CoA ligase [Rickettsiales bacterium]